jgi:hypothetical protein
VSLGKQTGGRVDLKGGFEKVGLDRGILAGRSVQVVQEAVH